MHFLILSPGRLDEVGIEIFFILPMWEQACMRQKTYPKISYEVGYRIFIHN